MRENGKDIDPNLLIQNYKKSLNSFRSSRVLQERLMKSQTSKQIAIQSHKDIDKMVKMKKETEISKPEIKDLTNVNPKDSLEAPEKVVISKVSPSKIEREFQNEKNKYDYPIEETKKKADPDEQEDSEFEENSEKAYLAKFAVFNLNYDFESETFVDFDRISPIFLEVPPEKDIYKFCKKIMICSKMEKEIPIIALLYVEKLMLKTGLLMNQINWRRFTFIALVIASKVFFIIK